MILPLLWDLHTIHLVQGWGEWLLQPLEVITQFAATPIFLFLIPLVFWSLNKKFGQDLMFLLIISATCNSILKAVIKYPRPYWLDSTLRRTFATGFSVPSGHTQTGTAIYGYLSWQMLAKNSRRRVKALLGIALILLIVAIAFSRIYLGVHFLGDTILGAIIGLAVLVTYLFLKPVVNTKIKNWSLLKHCSCALLTAVLIIWLARLGLVLPIGPCQYPSNYFLLGDQPAINDITIIAGLLFAFWVGLVAEARYVKFSTNIAIWQRLARYIFGMTVIIIVQTLEKFVPLTAMTIIGQIWAFIYVATIGLWITCIWPWVFSRLARIKLPILHRCSV